MPAKKYRIELTTEEQQELKALVSNSRASLRSIPTWSGDAWNEWTPSSGDIWRPSVNGWSGTWTPCCPCRQ